MSGYRFILALVSLVFIFVGGGYLIDHWDKPLRHPGTVPGKDAGTSIPATEPVVTAQTRAAEEQTPATVGIETRARKEFDAAAADAAAEADAKAAAETPTGEHETSTATPRSIVLRPELVTLDTAQLSATTASVIAGKAPTGTEVTLLANGAPLGQATADESSAWTIIIDEPLAPGSYKLKLSAVSSAGGAAVVRDAGEVSVETPASETVAGQAPAAAEAAGAPASQAGQAEPTNETSTSAATQASTPAAEAQAQATVSAPVPAVEITVPAPSVEIAGVPPDLMTPSGPAKPDSEAPTVAAATADVAPPAAESADNAASATSQAEPASEAAPVQVAQNDDSLTTQAGEVADSITTMFTDWLNATKEQAEEAAKTFTLANASYKPTADGAGVVTLSGRGPAKAKVQVMVDRQALGSTDIADSGRWLLEVPKRLQPGEHAARAEILAADGTLIVGRDLAFVSASPPEVVAAAPATAGESEASTPGLAPIPLVVSSVSYEAMGAKQGRITVSGRAQAGASIAIAADGVRIGTAIATPQGTWELASDTWLDAGAHAIRAERLADNGEVMERMLSEFVRSPTELEVASSAPEVVETPTETEVVDAEPQSAAAKPRNRKVRSQARRRMQLAAQRHRTGKRSNRQEAAEQKSSGYRIVNVVRGKMVSRVRVRTPGRKGRIVSFVVPKGPGWYRVRRGDSLWRIADRWYGDGRSYPVIAGFNAARVPVPDRVRPRQRLRVP